MSKKDTSCSFDESNAVPRTAESGETIICRCEEVTAREIENAMSLGAETLNEVKRITRAGMGLCQGRTCGNLVRRMFAERKGIDLGQVEPTRVRLPVRPIPLETIGSGVELEEFRGPAEKDKPLGWRYMNMYIKESEPQESAATPVLHSTETSRKVDYFIIEFERGGHVRARLLWDDAPTTCRRFCESLPLELKLIHASLAGAEIYSDDLPFELDFENATIDVKPGDVVSVPSNAVPWLKEKESSSFCVFYGKGRPYKDLDEPVRANLFARIDDIATVAEIGRKVKSEGPVRVMLRAL